MFRNLRLYSRTLQSKLFSYPHAKLIACLLALTLCAFSPHSSRAGDADIAKKFINATTVAILKIDTKRLDLPEALETAISNNKSLPAGIESAVRVIKDLKQLLNGEVVFIAADIPYSQGQTPLRLYIREEAISKSDKLLGQLQTLDFGTGVAHGDYRCFSLVSGVAPPEQIEFDEKKISSERPELAEAFQATEAYPIQLLILPPNYIWASLRDLMPNMPAKLGGGPTSTLIDGFVWNSIGMDPTTFQIESIVQSKSAEAAKAFCQQMPKLIEGLVRESNVPLSDSVKQWIAAQIRPVQKDNRLTIKVNSLSLVSSSGAVVTETLKQMAAPIVNQTVSNRFKHIVLAIHNYESAFKVFPPNAQGRNADGKCLLSWRVHLLPYLDEAKLYAQFHLNEPWDSEHNIKLLEKMPEVFQSPLIGNAANAPKRGYTTFLAPVGEGTIFGGNKPVKFANVKDGTSNTVLMVEVKPELAKPWTAPDDYDFDPTNPAKGLEQRLGLKPSFMSAFADGSVQSLSLELPAQTLLHLFQMSDGNVISW